MAFGWVILAIGVVLLAWPQMFVRVAHFLRPIFPPESTTTTLGAARLAGVVVALAGALTVAFA